jgi:hypothetical protein
MELETLDSFLDRRHSFRESSFRSKLLFSRTFLREVFFSFPSFHIILCDIFLQYVTRDRPNIILDIPAGVVFLSH